MDRASDFYKKPSKMSPYATYGRQLTDQKGGSLRSRGGLRGYYSPETERKMDNAASDLLAGLLGLSAGLQAYKKMK